MAFGLEKARAWLPGLRSGKRSGKLFFLVCILAAVFAPITAVALGNLPWDTNSSSDFAKGTYFQADFNADDANGFVYITGGNTQGDYNSEIFDANYTAYWETLSWEYKDIECPTGMSFIPKLGGFCIDAYEASRSDATFCGNDTNWAYPGDCNTHYGTSTTPASVADRIPWVSISLYDANTACAAAGKRLCTSAEWMAAANLNGQIYDLNNVGTQNNCIVDSTLYCLDHSASTGEACNTGSNQDTNAPSNCKSAEGVFDMIGNVWEWTSDIVDVNSNSSNDAWQYPNDSNSPPLWNQKTPSLHYGNDGVYTSTTKTGKSVLRGGGWGYVSRAGLFCVYLSGAPGHTYYTVGF
ncbi:MAG: SUMF1/EgtB/PvdO family nonheme iron enzyme, partial [Candidatus Diapherotrites archaeon]|nr:SUMF1/EgtB/PvdO family nonheme iron enzyme [Candidatus Diapherotrites archaeon]